MKSLGLFLFIILTQSCLAQFKATRLDKHSVHKNIQYNGNILQAVRWTYTTGDKIVILTATDKTRSKGPVGGRDAALYAYQYLVSGDSIKQDMKGVWLGSRQGSSSERG